MAESPQVRSVLLIESDAGMRERVAGILVAAGYQVDARERVEPGADPGPLRNQDAIVATLDWPGESNARRVSGFKRLAAGVPLLLITPPDRVELAVQALRHGAEDYLLRPPDPFELATRLERILDRKELDSRLAFYQNELSKKSVSKRLEARSPAMRSVLERVMRVAPMRSTVLIYGESGVGKELVARSIHFNSPRRERPFIALNCAAMPANLIETELFGHERGSFTGAHARARGKFEIAHQGTLFLDEIGDMDPNTQAKLLRVLEEREFMRIGGSQSIRVDVRLIAATNAPLETLVSENRFRQDLYYRLKVVTIHVPPLRERREDIPQLVHTFLDELARTNAVRRKTITADAQAALQDYAWPGNVRELKNLLESALVSYPGDVIRADELPQAIRQTGGDVPASEFVPGMTLADMERELIRKTLEHTGGNRTHSASLLGIGVRTLQRKIMSYDIHIPPRRRRSRSR